MPAFSRQFQTRYVVENRIEKSLDTLIKVRDPVVFFADLLLDLRNYELGVFSLRLDIDAPQELARIDTSYSILNIENLTSWNQWGFREEPYDRDSEWGTDSIQYVYSLAPKVLTVPAQIWKWPPGIWIDGGVDLEIEIKHPDNQLNEQDNKDPLYGSDLALFIKHPEELAVSDTRIYVGEPEEFDDFDIEIQVFDFAIHLDPRYEISGSTQITFDASLEITEEIETDHDVEALIVWPVEFDGDVQVGVYHEVDLYPDFGIVIGASFSSDFDAQQTITNTPVTDIDLLLFIQELAEKVTDSLFSITNAIAIEADTRQYVRRTILVVDTRQSILDPTIQVSADLLIGVGEPLETFDLEQKIGQVTQRVDHAVNPNN